MKYEYNVQIVDFEQVNTQCNALGQQGWDLVTAYPSARANCCNQAVPTIVLIFRRNA
ncbi:DUF4177 domain-containing protein [Sphaerospermopsis aphanizomenoides BCCUSP55]|jgi:hypothetical protein|uniref:DUF4177 domain-containing protein n=1 Tax=Sphaerospermopsis aphanizomenoides TaxID=459663 RepID=UPI0019069023|nr:DUF4177 domain-containing protein [Sphaerospermopsis aphanizomenoides]MBK1987926.1 DUF4177 domain-containing protein [Sphaerospermopsis aphanizomenoides BCCUSP55]